MAQCLPVRSRRRNPDSAGRRLTFAIYPSLAGRVVFVTGGATGIGADIVRAFARKRARVAFVDLQREAGEALAERIAARRRAAPLFLDVRRHRHSRRCRRRSRKRARRSGRSACWSTTPPTTSGTRSTRSRSSTGTSAQNVNLRHHFFAAQAVHPQMRELGGGSIINLSSIAWRFGAAEMPAYAAAKAAVVGLTRALARAFGPDNIRVNAIEPGAVMTERQRAALVQDARNRSRRWSQRQLHPRDAARRGDRARWRCSWPPTTAA